MSNSCGGGVGRLVNWQHLEVVPAMGNRAPGPHTGSDGPSAIPGLGIPGVICGSRVARGEKGSLGEDTLQGEPPVLPSTFLAAFCVIFK